VDLFLKHDQEERFEDYKLEKLREVIGKNDDDDVGDSLSAREMSPTSKNS
jgi:hypothetical protein